MFVCIIIDKKKKLFACVTPKYFSTFNSIKKLIIAPKIIKIMIKIVVINKITKILLIMILISIIIIIIVVVIKITIIIMIIKIIIIIIIRIMIYKNFLTFKSSFFHIHRSQPVERSVRKFSNVSTLSRRIFS